MGIKRLWSKQARKKHTAKKAARREAELMAAQVTGNVKDIVKAQEKVSRSKAAANAYLQKYRSAVDAAERYCGAGSPAHRQAVAKLIRKASKIGVAIPVPEFPEPKAPKKGKQAVAATA